MIILGIETSCDETAAAVIENLHSGGVRILSTITATSAGLHARTGGVIPEDAARKQIQAIIPVISLALEEARVSPAQIDTIGVTAGPGLIGSLLVGVETAKTLAFVWKKPIVPVNHLVGHLYANWIVTNEKIAIPQFPAIGLVVSGGHTDLVLMKDHQDIKLLGSTRDDAAGEAFDKTARLLGLSYPGGPNLSKIADEYRGQDLSKELTLFPRPMIRENNFDWSFSGLKTAALNEIKKLSGQDTSGIRLSQYQELSQNKKVQGEASHLAAEIQEAIVDVLVNKSLRAVEKYKPKSFLLAGGVSANKRLREKFEELTPKDVILFIPKFEYCTDNAAYIAASTFYHQNSLAWQEISPNPELTIIDHF